MADIDGNDDVAESQSNDKERCLGRLKWRPTSKSTLAQVEENILKHVQSTTERRFVDIKGSEQRIWTVILNKHLEATPLVMVHGMGGGVAMWVLNMDELAHNRPVYTFDLLGFGRSSRPVFSLDAKIAEQEFVDSLEEWREAVGLEKFILLGHSLGGFVSASYAIQHPERIEHLIQVDPWGYSEKPTDAEIREMASPTIRAIFKVLKKFNAFSILRAAGPFGPSIMKRLRSDIKDKYEDKLDEDSKLLLDYIYHCNVQKPSGEIGAKSLQTMVRWAKNPMICRITDLDSRVPITYIHGKDSWLPSDVGYRVKELRSQSHVQVEVIEDAGHHVYADQDAIFNYIVKRVVDKVD